MAKVFISAGHGGGDSGAAANGLIEKNMNLITALSMHDILVLSGVKVALSRTTDTDETLTRKIDACNLFAPDCAIEIHYNAGKGKGFEAYYQTNKFKENSYRLAGEIEKQVTALGQRTRGLKIKRNSTNTADYFAWLRLTCCPAVLVEGAFIDSDDRFNVDTIEKQQRFGKAYAMAVLSYLGISEKVITKTMKFDDLKAELQARGISSIIV